MKKSARHQRIIAILLAAAAAAAPATEPAPANALHEETVKRFRHAGIGGDNTP